MAIASTGSTPDRGPAVFAVTVSTLVVGTLFFMARMICRAWIVKRVSWDDYLIIIAWVLAAGLTTTIDVGTSFGLGRHDEDIADADLLPLRKTEYNPALMALKTSILIFYLRLAKNTQQILRIASWIVAVIVNVAGVVLTMLNIFQCHPVAASFSTTYSGQPKCIPLLTEFICSAPVNIVTDLAILALPIPVLTGMRLPKRQKYILVITFSLGIFVTIVDVVRIYYLQQAIATVSTDPSSDPSAIFGDSPEFPWNASLSLMWSAVEVNIGMICACVPTLKPLIIKILPAAILGPDGTQNSIISTYATGSDKETSPGTQIGTEPAMSRDGPPASPAAAAAATLPPMDLLDFLTTPDMTTATATATAGTRDRFNSTATTAWMSHRTRRDSAVYFGFVNMKRPKSMIKTSTADSLRYCIIVSTLFLLWGFSYGLLNTLNNVIADIADMSTAETVGLTSIYFGGGYFFGPLMIGEWVLRHDEHSRFHPRRRYKNRDPVGGFKATFILGLCIYGVGTIMFWPSAVLTSFPGFLISNFVVGFGLAVLETAANPFIILCGPPMYAEVRILIAQGFQGVATVVSGVLAQKVFFVNLGTGSRATSDELLDVQWTYLAITLFCVALALFFYYMPLPEVRDADLGRAAQRLPVDATKRSIGGLQLRTVCIILAVLAQWTYVAAQESMSIFFGSLVDAFLPGGEQERAAGPPGLSLSINDYIVVAHAVFAVSRFNAAHIAWYGVRHPHARLVPSPRTMLALFSALSALAALVCVVLPATTSTNPNIIAIPVLVFFFAEGPLWPLIFAIGLRGQGDRTKRAAAWLTMGASGPAIWPFVMYAVVSAGKTQLAFIVVVVLLLFTLAYPLYLTLVRDARVLVDPVFRGRPVGAGGGLGGLEGAESGPSSTRDQSLSADEVVRQRQQRRQRTGSSSVGAGAGAERGAGAIAMELMNKLTLGKKRDWRRKGSGSTVSDCPRCEHREMTSDGVGGGGQDRTGSTIPEER
ncbi:MFS general substrate transporter [Cryphonectria parasitica EP155]|uniref:MFS general substrate transporter n=1 Tax=Cryphonectria parasitica (strain ATCC 38755 / EP155) TaxID=660469 RepID=A0A9P5CIX8_CRYP1|nr:MFS general substrate transporter [Cryphonectria parasitica EP155]KAF3760728.1 MFS general substrate transporter [Cryphonectria parasitica EP155]